MGFAETVWRGKTATQRFDESHTPEPNSGCWLWIGNESREGYGTICIDGQHQRAHRASWMLHKGPIPDGMHVCHKCDTPQCVNPDHLFLGDDLANMRDRKAKGRYARIHGTRNPNAKLTEDSVRAIRGDRRPLRLIAADYGISISMASYVRRGDHWKHVS